MLQYESVLGRFRFGKGWLFRQPPSSTQEIELKETYAGPPKRTTSSPPKPPVEAKNKYKVVVFCNLAQITSFHELTPADLDIFIKETLVIGYAHNEPGVTTVYPGHTIFKIEAAIVA